MKKPCFGSTRLAASSRNPLSTTFRARDPMIDALKAIGIVSVVIGHVSEEWMLPIKNFVYTYHLMIFFFTAGLCFKEEYGQKPLHFFWKRLKRYWPLYFVTNGVCILLHNSFVKLGLLRPQIAVYSGEQIIHNLIRAAFFLQNEELLGPIWFMAPFLLAEVLFCLILWLGNHLCKIKGWVVALIASVLCGALGTMMMVRPRPLFDRAYHCNVALLGMAVLCMGFLVKPLWGKLKQKIRGWMCLPAGIALQLTLAFGFGRIELSRHEIMQPPFLFFPITCVGIIFTISLAKLLVNCRAENFLTGIGKESLYIMTFHFVVFKLIDLLFETCTRMPRQIESGFPCAYPATLFPVYYLLGVALPLGR